MWKNGEITFCPWDDNPYHMTADEEPAPRADFETIDPDHLEALDDLTGYTWGVYHIPRLAGKTDPGPLTRIPPYFLRTLELVRAKAGPDVSIHGEVFSPFTHFVELFGYENALLALLADPPKTPRAPRPPDRVPASPWAVAQARAGADAVLISSAFAGAPFLSRGMYEELVVPYERRVAEAIRAEGVPVYTHTCGRIGDRLDLMLETGPAASTRWTRRRSATRNWPTPSGRWATRCSSRAIWTRSCCCAPKRRSRCRRTPRTVSARGCPAVGTS